MDAPVVHQSNGVPFDFVAVNRQCAHALFSADMPGGRTLPKRQGKIIPIRRNAGGQCERSAAATDADQIVKNHRIQKGCCFRTALVVRSSGFHGGSLHAAVQSVGRAAKDSHSFGASVW